MRVRPVIKSVIAEEEKRGMSESLMRPPNPGTECRSNLPDEKKSSSRFIFSFRKSVLDPVQLEKCFAWSFRLPFWRLCLVIRASLLSKVSRGLREEEEDFFQKEKKRHVNKVSLGLRVDYPS